MNISTINKSLRRIHGGGTYEHCTGMAANGLLNHYFDNSRFTNTPE